MITGTTLIERGWPQDKSLGIAKRIVDRLAEQGWDEKAILATLDAVRDHPERYVGDEIYAPLAENLVRQIQRDTPIESELRAEPLPYPIWGRDEIEAGALRQMATAMRLPVSISGALLPDAHQGYGLPIGGVLATENSVIPYAVGVDIACRMRLSVYPIGPAVLDRDRPRFRQALLDHTYFGPGVSNPERPSHAVLDDAAWKETRFLRGLQSIATRQLGTSGSGNHFVEFGELEVTRGNLGVTPGRFLALLSHSGSRRVGHQIATHYSKVAVERHKNLDREARHLAWLPLDSEEGQEYWIGMELAGRFASANHWVIHHAVAAALGLEEVVAVENHHNFAWKEIHQGREVIVHRKGATPAGAGVLGVIPGSMADPGYVVRGKGLASSLHSASHGAGRIMSRTAAFKSISAESRNAYLQDRGVELLSGGLDEAPQAYKRIEQVMALQEDLIDILGTFRPRLVRMAQEVDDI